MEKKKEKLGTIAAVIAILAGIAALAYPFLSNWLYERSAASSVRLYDSGTEAVGEAGAVLLRKPAEAYNAALAEGQGTLREPFGEAADSGVPGEDSGGAEELRDYWDILDLGEGLMCSVEIPCIGVYLPVYHGTNSEVLEKGVGHLRGSSFPIGGESTHCVLSGHSGLNTAKLFTDLTMVEEGDVFYLHILGETLAYQTDRIMVVEPEEISALEIIEGEDYVTLVTCTPYGINSHRLLVRGKRIPYTEEAYKEMAAKEKEMPASRWMEEYKKACLAAGGGILVIVLLQGILRIKKGKRHGKQEAE